MYKYYLVQDIGNNVTQRLYKGERGWYSTKSRAIVFSSPLEADEYRQKQLWSKKRIILILVEWSEVATEEVNPETYTYC